MVHRDLSYLFRLSFTLSLDTLHHRNQANAHLAERFRTHDELLLIYLLSYMKSYSIYFISVRSE